MKRREFLECTAVGVTALAASPGFARQGGAALLVTDRPLRAIPGCRTIQVDHGQFLPMDCLAGAAPGSRVVGVVGAANAVLLMELLRGRRASVSYAGEADGTMFLIATA
jgi:hypothetical protein